MLTNLPRDATQALADVESIDSGKGGVFLSATARLAADHDSHRPIPASAISANIEEQGVQGERFTEI